MKRFITQLSLFAVPLLLLAAATEYALSSLPHEFQYKASYMVKHAEELEVLVFGLSHTHKINLNYIGRPAFNLAYSSQSIDRDYMLWQKYRDRLTSLRYVVIPLSCWFHENNIDGKEPWRTPFYTIYFRLPAPLFDLQKRFIIANPTIACKMLGRLFSGRHEEPDYDKFGSSMTTASERQSYWERQSGRGIAEMHSAYTSEQAETNRATLERFVTECAERNIRVLLITPPTWHTYYDHLTAEVIEKTEKTGRETAARHPNVTYLNLLKDKRFISDDYYNASHLNYDIGGRKLSLLLHEYIAADSLQNMNKGIHIIK